MVTRVRYNRLQWLVNEDYRTDTDGRRHACQGPHVGILRTWNCLYSPPVPDV